MPKFAHTMAIPPGFPAYRRRDMRAKKSSKNLLRISGLALVFMLAVALLVSAISFTRTGAQSDNVAFAKNTYEPSMKELAIDSTGAWKWNIPLKTSADGNIATYTFTPNTYANYFAFIGGQTTLYNIKVHSSSTGAYTSSSGGVVGSVRERLYAYYKLPDELVSLGATIELTNLALSVATILTRDLTVSETECLLKFLCIVRDDISLILCDKRNDKS